MRSGRLRHVVEIQQAIETQDATGAAIQTWQTFAQVRGSYLPVTGKEQFTSKQDFAQQTARFKIRFCSGITPKMRVLFHGRYFDIKSVIDMYGRGRELEIIAEENV